MPINYFISYSHLDQTLVEPVVKIIQLSESFVFFDKWSIPPGSTWEDEIHKGIEKADKVLLSSGAGIRGRRKKSVKRLRPH